MIPYGPFAPRRPEDAQLPGLRVEPAVDPALAREPEDPAPVEGRRVEVRVARARREREASDLPRPRVDADDCVQAAVGDPGSAVGPDDHAVRRGAGAQRRQPRAPVPRVQPAQLARVLRRVPDASVPGGRDVVRVRPRRDPELPNAKLALTRTRGARRSRDDERDGGGRDPHEHALRYAGAARPVSHHVSQAIAIRTPRLHVARIRIGTVAGALVPLHVGACSAPSQGG